MDLKLKGRSVLVTGSSMGIGLAVAKVMAAEGCSLHLAARNAERLNVAAADIAKIYGVSVIPHPADLSRTEEVLKLAEACGDVDILVNNAGGIPRGTLQEVDGATWRRAWDLKVFGYIALTRAIIAKMYARKKGAIVNVIGAAAERLDPNYIAGCTGNAALNAFTQCLGSESMVHGVRVVAVNPGPIMTDRFMNGLYWRAEKRFGDRNRWQEILTRDIPVGRAGTPEEVAHAVAFLASDLSSYTSGEGFRIDAGFSGSLKVTPD